MTEPSGRVDMLWDILKRMEDKLDQALDDHEKRLQNLEKTAYASVRLWQRVAFVAAPLIGAVCGWLVSYLPKRG